MGVARRPARVLLELPMKPVVLIPSCNRMLGAYPNHVVGSKYVNAVRLAGCLPLIVPS